MAGPTSFRHVMLSLVDTEAPVEAMRRFAQRLKRYSMKVAGSLRTLARYLWGHTPPTVLFLGNASCYSHLFHISYKQWYITQRAKLDVTFFMFLALTWLVGFLKNSQCEEELDGGVAAVAC